MDWEIKKQHFQIPVLWTRTPHFPNISRVILLATVIQKSYLFYSITSILMNQALKYVSNLYDITSYELKVLVWITSPI